jgi:hypothetical protein
MLDTIIIIYFIIIIISCQLAIASKPVDEVVHKAQVVNVIIHVSWKGSRLISWQW